MTRKKAFKGVIIFYYLIQIDPLTKVLEGYFRYYLSFLTNTRIQIV